MLSWLLHKIIWLLNPTSTGTIRTIDTVDNVLIG